MEIATPTIGCHLSTKKGFLNMAEEIVSLNANTFQYFSRNPRGGKVRKENSTDIKSYIKYASEHNISTIMAYAPYDIEPATNDMNKRDFALAIMSEDMTRLESIPNQRYLLRPGSAVDISTNQALENLSTAINQTLSIAQTSILLLCNMPGEGMQIGSTFEELSTILNNINLKDHIGICLDAASLWATGYDIVHDLDNVLAQFDKLIGLNKLLAIHLNDPIEPFNSHADKHTRIGQGTIGFDALKSLYCHPELRDVAFYLEEPKADLQIYKEDINRFLDAYKIKYQ